MSAPVVTTHPSYDGVATIVQIDTPDGVGRLRVYINDGQPIWDADPESEYPVPEGLAAITASRGGVFRNADGDHLVEPADNDGEMILIRADGTTATLRGFWETGFDA